MLILAGKFTDVVRIGGAIRNFNDFSPNTLYDPYHLLCRGLSMLRNYFAGFEMTAETMDHSISKHMHYRLVSFFYMMQLSEEKRSLFFAEQFKRSRTSFMLDSGAYSAHTKGQIISFNEYLRFCWTHYDDFTYFVNLDSIPEDWTKADLAEEAAETSRNYYLDMRDFFTLNDMDVDKILPVFHQGEDEKYLKWMLEERIPYIGLSPSNDVSRTDKQDKHHFLMCCFDVINHSRNSNVKTHAFGLSSYELVPDFPFYSADSTTWGDNGTKYQIIVPKRRSKLLKKSIKEDFKSRWDYDFHVKWDFTEIEPVLVGSVAKKLGDPKYYLNKYPQKRIREINEYIRDLGFHIGYQTIRERTTLGKNRELLNDNEEPLDPRTQKAYLEKVYDEIIAEITVTGEPTLMDDGKPRIGVGMATRGAPQWRLLMNAITVNKWTETLDPFSFAVPSYLKPHLTPEEISRKGELYDKIHKRLNKKMKMLPTFRRMK